MTPNDIEILIHCHVSATPHPRRDAPAVNDALRMLLNHGLIKQVQTGHDEYVTTDRGAAHVKQLCRLSFPTPAWIGVNGEVLNDD